MDGQEIEQIYITSPFLPISSKRNARRYRDHNPDFYYGRGSLAGEVGGVRTGSGLHARSAGSYEWGIGIFGLALPINRMHTFGMTTAFQIGYSRLRFDKHYAMFNVDGHTMVLPLDGEENAEKSYMSYWFTRVPIIFEWQKRVGNREIYAGLGVSVEYRRGEHSRYKGGASGTITPTDDLNMNPVGLNLETHMGYEGIMLYMRTALTPLLNTSAGPRCYPVSIGLGFKLW